MRRPTFRPLAGLALTLALALSLPACRAAGGSGGGAEGPGWFGTGPGLTTDAIRLGVIIDLTGPFAPAGTSLSQGTQLYWQRRNQAGGVCGRSVELRVVDHGYDPQKALGLYREMAPDVLGLQTLLGSSVLSALLPTLEQDGMLVGLAGWTSEVLPNPLIQLIGTTHDVEAISAIDFLMGHQGLGAGDTIGHVYLEGDYGENALRGSRYMARQKGMTLVEQKVKPTDTDLSAQAAAFRRAGVKAILISGSPTQSASLAGVASAAGLDVPIVSSLPGFSPQILDTPAGEALEANLHVVSSTAPLSLDAPAVREAAAVFEQALPYSLPMQPGFIHGYTQARLMDAVLQKACDNRDLTRQGLTSALHQISGFDSGGLVAGPLSYTDPARPPTMKVYVAKADRTARGGLRAVGGVFESESAKRYPLPS
jgi:ABC-type branched-subunit amino acid transport system substrate-binding protein